MWSTIKDVIIQVTTNLVRTSIHTQQSKQLIFLLISLRKSATPSFLPEARWSEGIDTQKIVL